MPVIDIYLDCEEERRKRRRGKWLLPLLVGLGAALALGREKPPAPVPPKPVAVIPAPVIVQKPTVVEAPIPAPARMAVAPARMDFGDGPLTRGIPAQMAIIRNDGGQPLASVSAVADGPFLITSGCQDALAPGERCMVAVVFAPKQPGRFTGSLNVAANDQRAHVVLRGSVPRPVEIAAPLPPPQVIVQAPAPAPPAPPPPPPARMLCFEPAFVRFTSTGKQTITLTNPEPTPLRVVAVVPLGRQGQTVSGYEIDSRRCLRVLNGGQQCKFTISASELALQTRETMQLTVYYEDPATGGRRAARFSSACGNR